MEQVWCFINEMRSKVKKHKEILNQQIKSPKGMSKSNNKEGTTTADKFFEDLLEQPMVFADANELNITQTCAELSEEQQYFMATLKDDFIFFYNQQKQLNQQSLRILPDGEEYATNEIVSYCPYQKYPKYQISKKCQIFKKMSNFQQKKSNFQKNVKFSKKNQIF